MGQDENLSALIEQWSAAHGCDRESFLCDLGLKIEKMWSEDPHKLLNTLYRLDVSESKLDAVIKKSTETTLGRGIAELVLERELQKAKTRSTVK